MTICGRRRRCAYPGYHYDQAAYVQSIKYGGRLPDSGDYPDTGTGHTREIAFTYGTRSDVFTWVPPDGDETQELVYLYKKKLDRIDVKTLVSGSFTTFRSYLFSYDYCNPYWHVEPYDGELQQQKASKLLLLSVTEQDGSGNSLPATSFTYYSGAMGTYPSGTTEYYKYQLHEITNGYGGKVHIAYGGHNAKRPNGDWCVLKRRYRVTQQQTEGGMGEAGLVGSTVTLDYEYPPVSAPDYVGSYVDYDNCPIGHQWVKVTDSEGHHTQSYFYATAGDDGKTQADVLAMKGRCYKVERYKASGPTLVGYDLTTWSYQKTTPGYWGDYYWVRQEEVRQYQGSASRKTAYSYDSYGSVSEVKEYDSASAANWAMRKSYDRNTTVNETDHTGYHHGGRQQRGPAQVFWRNVGEGLIDEFRAWNHRFKMRGGDGW